MIYRTYYNNRGATENIIQITCSRYKNYFGRVVHTTKAQPTYRTISWFLVASGKIDKRMRAICDNILR